MVLSKLWCTGLCLLMCSCIVLGQNLQLNGVPFENNSNLVLGDLGVGESALWCMTTNTQCCRNADTVGSDPLGEWYFPDGSQVLDGQDASRSIFRNRGPMIVRLNRRNNPLSPTGIYRCEILDDSGSFVNVFAGLYLAPSPTSLASSSQSPTSITLSWEQPAGDDVDTYDIVYTYQGGCSDYTQPENMATVNDGDDREFILGNLQEFSSYMISLTAFNNAGESATLTITTSTASTAPSGPPQSVEMVSVSASSVTIQWGCVSCIDRNSEITGYTVQYGQTDSNTTVLEPVTGTSDSERMFTASGLIPRTSYTIEVAADSSEGTGPFSMAITVETTVPENASLSLNGELIANNSEVYITDVDEGDLALYCVTDEEECCSSSETGGEELGSWFFPNNDEVGSTESDFIYVVRGASTVALNRNNVRADPLGVYRCEIPEASGIILSFYVGLVSVLDEAIPISIQSVQFELTSDVDAATPSFNLHCVTTGGPVDFNDITWTRAGSSLPANHSLFQALDDGSTATYSNTLAVAGGETGQYTCQLEHSGNKTSADITVEAANPPTGLMAIQEGANNILVSWTPPVSSGAVVTGYFIYIDEVGDNPTIIVRVFNRTATEVVYTVTDTPTSYMVSMVALSDRLPSTLVGPEEITFVVAPPPMRPTNFAIRNDEFSVAQVILSWEQPAGDVVDRYEILYIYQGECSDYIQFQNSTTVEDSNAREYTLQSLQEFSVYIIALTAVGPTGLRSTPASATITTRPAAPDGLVSVMSSVTSINITIQWGSVSCINRNSEITGYTVRYGQTGSTETDMEPVSGTTDSDRMFTASELIPSTNYTFGVAAVNSENIGTYTEITVATSDLLFQIQLNNDERDCISLLTATNDTFLLTEITNFIVNETEALCNCGFTSQNIPDGMLMCFQTDSTSITYRGSLLPTSTASSPTLASFIQEWIEEADLEIPELGVTLSVDSSCTVVVSSLGEEQCLMRPTEKPGLSERNKIIIGVVVGVGGFILLLLLLLCLYCCCYCCCWRDSSEEESKDEAQMQQKEQSSTDIEIHYTEEPTKTEETALHDEQGGNQYEDVDTKPYENASGTEGGDSIVEEEGASGRESYIA